MGDWRQHTGQSLCAENREIVEDWQVFSQVSSSRPLAGTNGAGGIVTSRIEVVSGVGLLAFRVTFSFVNPQGSLVEKAR